VLTWATTWHAITDQIAPISPVIGVGLRLGLAGLLVVGACAVRGVRLPSTWRGHAMPALQVIFLYGVRPTLLELTGAAPAGVGNALMLRRFLPAAAADRSRRGRAATDRLPRTAD
jgi:hypothetical protein